MVIEAIEVDDLINQIKKIGAWGDIYPLLLAIDVVKEFGELDDASSVKSILESEESLQKHVNDVHCFSMNPKESAIVYDYVIGLLRIKKGE